MTHVKTLQAGHSSQGTTEPITPGRIVLPGALFDAEGIMRPWWDWDSQEEYFSRLQCVADYYSTKTYRQYKVSLLHDILLDPAHHYDTDWLYSYCELDVLTMNVINV